MTKTLTRVLMVSTEYPPMQGGVGRYTSNLTRELRKIGYEVDVACNEKGDGNVFGLSPDNSDNSGVLLKIVDKVHPDIVHVQFEHGLYGIVLDPLNPKKTITNIDSFYEMCKVPIVTTFHSAYSFKEWMNLVVPLKRAGWTGKVGVLVGMLKAYWEHLLNYKSFHKLNKDKLGRSQAGIVFSNHLSKMIGGGEVIYHGAESFMSVRPTKKEARAKFSLPQEGRLALALGFRTATKGWDVLEKMKVPDGWSIVVSSSKNHYNKENLNLQLERNNNIIVLDRDFLSEKDLALLFYASDAIVLPYKVSSGSGVMFDALAHGLPFVATDLEFFKEFSTQGVGITVKRDSNEFSNGLVAIERGYANYKESVDIFKKKLRWDVIAKQHANVYSRILEKEGDIIAASTIVLRKARTNTIATTH
ncbi:MAG TPA: glycosyltransferase family 4 protein [Nitrososphaeraceae archaeon]